MDSSRLPGARPAGTAASAPSAGMVIFMIAGKLDFSRINLYVAA